MQPTVIKGIVHPKTDAELWAGLDGPEPAHIDSWPAQSEIEKK